MNCKICQSPSNFFGNAKILKKYFVNFYRCGYCGYIQSETPYWKEEAYSDVITKSDIGLINRNLRMAEITKDVILTCFDPKDRFVDYGGGYGIFVRLMRDQGFNFYRYDPLCENIFAVGFEAETCESYVLLTAWEVFEHLENPVAEIEKMLSLGRNILFSTCLLPSQPKPLEEWWYYGLEHGQHLSFYTRKSLEIIAREFDLKLHFSNGFVHFLGVPSINSILIGIALNPHLRILRKFLAKPQPNSLLETDYSKIVGRKLR